MAPAHEDAQVVHVSQFVLGDYRVRCSRLSGASSSSRAVDEQFHFGREVVVNNVLEQGNVNTSSSKIGDEEHFDYLLAELVQSIFSGPLVHGTVNIVTRKAGFLAQLTEIFNVVFCGPEDYCLLLASNLLVENVEQHGLLLYRTHHVEIM